MRKQSSRYPSVISPRLIRVHDVFSGALLVDLAKFTCLSQLLLDQAEECQRDHETLSGSLSESVCSSLNGGGEGLLGDEDTIEELTLILLADLANLADTGAGLGKETDVSAVEDELILDILRGIDGAALVELDNVGLLTTEEVLDLDVLAVLGDDSGNGEMRMHKSHLVSEALYE